MPQPRPRTPAKDAPRPAALPTLAYDPPLPPGSDGGAFFQSITLHDGPTLIGRASWHAVDADAGVAQLTELFVEEAVRRRRHGRKLVEAVIAQAKAHCRARRCKLRRLWADVRQKSHVHGRAFLAGNGFHHVATVKDLYPDEDGLIYARTFD